MPGAVVRANADTIGDLGASLLGTGDTTGGDLAPAITTTTPDPDLTYRGGPTGGGPTGGGPTGGGPSGGTTPTTPTTATTPTTPTTPTTATTPRTPTSSDPVGPGVTPGGPFGPGSSGDTHGGGGYGGDGYVSGSPEDEVNLADLVDGNTTSIDDIIKGNKYAKVPTSSVPLSSKNRSSGSAVIPIAAGLSAAAAAGIGAKAYIDHKKNSDNDDDEIYTDEWDGDENTDMEFTFGDDAVENKENYLDDEDDYSYQAAMEDAGYVSASSDELTDL